MSPVTLQYSAITKILKKNRFFLSASFFVAIVFIFTFFWSWDWFIVRANTRLTTMLHRKVTVEHLYISPGITTTIHIKGVKISQPDLFSNEEKSFGEINEAIISFNIFDYIWNKKPHLMSLSLNKPEFNLTSLNNGINNYTFTDNNISKKHPYSTLPYIDKLYIEAGVIHFISDPLQTDIIASIESDPGNLSGNHGFLRINASGRYAQQPITINFTGGNILSVFNEKSPFPVNLRIQNGSTIASLSGLVEQVLTPEKIKAHLKLRLSGSDMTLLYPLTGFQTPQTSDYTISSAVDYTQNKIIFKNLSGKTGNSDFAGTIQVKPHTKPLFIEASIFSQNMYLNDLTKFTKIAAEETDHNTNSILPDTPFNTPKFTGFNAHISYQAALIQNKNFPLSNIDADFLISDGSIALRHLNFEIGNGTVTSAASLTPEGNLLNAAASIYFSQIDLARLMQASPASHARGIIGGHLTLTSKGNSVASLIAAGNGNLTLILDQGENITAFMPDILGMALTNALLTAIGNPSNTELHCLIADMPLENGVASTKAFFLATDTNETFGNGTVNFRDNTLDYSLTTRFQKNKHLLSSANFHISGLIKKPKTTSGTNTINQSVITSEIKNIFPLVLFMPVSHKKIFTIDQHEESALLRKAIIKKLSESLGLNFAISSVNQTLHSELNDSSSCSEALGYRNISSSLHSENKEDTPHKN